MARVLKFNSTCFYCGKNCDPVLEKRMLKEGEIKHLSFLHRSNGRWYGHCGDCYEKKKTVKRIIKEKCCYSNDHH
jgi:hypothetical protein